MSNDLLTVAYHEAGHGVAAIDVGFPFTHITVWRSKGTNYGGYVHNVQVLKGNGVFSAFEQDVIVSLAGGIAERRFAPRSRWRWGCSWDHEYIYSIGATPAEIRRLEPVTVEIIDRLWEDVTRLAQVLVHCRYVNADQVREIMGRPRRRAARRLYC